MSAALERLLLAGPATGAAATAALVARVIAGSVFVVFGIGKFSEHAAEVDAFERYGLPSADAFVYLVGVIEIAGGLLLLFGLATRVAALVLACNMVGAIVLAGIVEGEIISLTLAPAMLAATALVVIVGPGYHALDRRLRGS